MKRIAIACIALCAAALLAACSSSASPSGSSSSSAESGSSAVESTASASASDSSASQSGAVTIGLEYSAGTGYEWGCSIEPEGVIEQVDRTTESLSEDKAISGGPLRDDFTFRATSPGEVVITFDLARSWEDGEPAETQVYAFTVNDDLEMVLNPYKSQFENEPEWK